PLEAALPAAEMVRGPLAVPAADLLRRFGPDVAAATGVWARPERAAGLSRAQALLSLERQDPLPPEAIALALAVVRDPPRGGGNADMCAALSVLAKAGGRA